MNLKFSRPIYSLTILMLLLSLQLTVNGQATCPDNFSVCQNSPEFTLTGASPVGGLYSGPNVLNGKFYPLQAGEKTITYSYTNQGNVVNTCAFKIQVKEVPMVFYSLGIIPECMDIGIQNVTMGFGGAFFDDKNVTSTTWSGPGISGNEAAGYTFDPMVAGVGLHILDAISTLENGCAVSHGGLIAIDGVAAVTCPSDFEVRVTDDPFTLTGAKVTSQAWDHSTLSGNYSGPGVTTLDSQFNPSVAGDGTHVITYSQHGCGTATCTFNIKTLPLPVKLVSFRAKKLENYVLITWETERESLFDRFEVEKSYNAKQGFIKISEVKGQGSKSSYSFIDQNAERGIPLYYRLKMVDKDGSYAYSKVTWALVETKGTLSVYPNPASREIRIGSSLEMTEAKLINMSGSEVFSEKYSPAKNKVVTLPKLPGGIYLLQVKNAAGISAFSKVIIN